MSLGTLPDGSGRSAASARFSISGVLGLALMLALPLAFISNARLEAQAVGKKVALVIGNAAYSRIPALKNPANDAADMRQSLERLGFTVIGTVNADRRAMRGLVDDFLSKARAADIALFYYSGHGVQYEGENYLVPVGAEVSLAPDVVDECLPLARVVTRMNEAGAGTSIIILDACRDNPFVAVTRGIDRGLAVIAQKPRESIVVYATGENQKAEDGSGRNGVFTGALLANLGRDESFTDILLEVKAQVRRETGDRQQPAVYENLTRKVYLGGAASAPIARVTTPTPADTAGSSLPAATARDHTTRSESANPYGPRSVAFSAVYDSTMYTSTYGHLESFNDIRIDSFMAQIAYSPNFSNWLSVLFTIGYDGLKYREHYYGYGLNDMDIKYLGFGLGLSIEYKPLDLWGICFSAIPESWLRVSDDSKMRGPRYHEIPKPFLVDASFGLRIYPVRSFSLGVELNYKFFTDPTIIATGYRIIGQYRLDFLNP